MFWSGDLDRFDKCFHHVLTVYTIIVKDYIDQSHLHNYDSLTLDWNLALDNIQLLQLILKSYWTTIYL